MLKVGQSTNLDSTPGTDSRIFSST